MTSVPPQPLDTASADSGIASIAVGVLLAHRGVLIAATVVAGLLGIAGSFLVTPTYSARVSIFPPQPHQSAAAAALASLSGMAGLGSSGGGAVKNPSDQYVALLQSTTIRDRIVDHFGLLSVYRHELRQDARKMLAERTRVSVGRKDGMLFIDVDDSSPVRAAEIANRYVEELRSMTATLAVTEAQHRRVFFEEKMRKARDDLTRAQLSLQSSGFGIGALQAEPRAAAETYAKLKAEAAAAEVRLQALRSTLTDNAPSVQRELSALEALRNQIKRLEAGADAASGNEYVSRYRDFKYHEGLFDMFSRQYELARVDESRQGALIQVVDVALPPERKSRPNRMAFAVGGAAFGFTATLVFLFFRKRVTHPLRRVGFE